MRRTLVALATLLCYGCTTVQTRTAVVQGPVARVALAEPELELYMEGTGPGAIDPAESARSLEAARAALAQALDQRGFATAGDADQVLVVRAAAVVRTEERRGKQVAGTIAAVLLVVAVIAILIAATQKGGGGRGVSGAVAPGRGAVPAARPGAFRPPYYGRPLYPAPWPWWGFGIQVHVPLYPMAAVPGPGGVAYAAPGLQSRLAARGFFSSDEVELVLELRDARSGRVLWSRATRAEVDVRDAVRLREVVDRALWDHPWARTVPPRAPPAPPPGPSPGGKEPASEPPVPLPAPLPPGTPV